jgi:hypothetical protein
MTKGYNRDSRPKVRSSGMKGFDKVAKNVFRGVADLFKSGDSLVKKYSKNKKKR